MQRWIVLGALVLSLLGGGLMFGYWKHRQSRPDRQWIPLPFLPESSEAQRNKSVEDLRQALFTDAVLTGIARDCNIESKWELGSEHAAVEELKRRIIVERGEMVFKGIPTPTLDIGFKGTVGEQPELKALAERLFADVKRIVTPNNPEPSAPEASTLAVPKF